MSLFKTTAELKQFFPARLTLAFDDLRPTLDQVEREYLADMVLGKDLYEWLEGGYQDDDLDDDGEELLKLCRPVVAHLAVYHFTGIANVELTSGGLAVASSDTLKPASEWRTRDLERAVLRQGHRAMDVLINWLIEHADEWEEWQESDLYQQLTAGYIRTTRQFDELLRIGNSGYLFRQLLPAIRRAERGLVADTLCSTDLALQLQSAITDASLTTEEAKLVELCRQAAAHLAMADSVVELSLTTDQQGTWTFGALLGGQTSGGPTPANEERLQARQDHMRALGRGYLKRLQQELQTQAEADTNHPYRASTCYVDPDAPVEEPDTDNPVGNFL